MPVRQQIRDVLSCSALLPSPRRPFCAALPTVGRTSPVCGQKHTHPVNVIRQVTQSDLGPRPDDADRTQHQMSGPLNLYPKDVLNPRTNPRLGLVAFLFSRCQWMITTPLAVDMFPKTILQKTLQSIRRSISRIRPDILARVLGKELLKHLAVMQGSIGHRI